MMGNKTPGYEIERKFLICMPEKTFLEDNADRILQIRQSYLATQKGESARVRQITEGKTVTYVHTVKRRISDIKREETEREISREEYEKLLRLLDKDRNEIIKTRYCLPHGNHIFEIDVFPFWTDKAFLEVELSCENETFLLPHGISVIREVTEDARYTNAALAREIPDEYE